MKNKKNIIKIVVLSILALAFVILLVSLLTGKFTLTFNQGEYNEIVYSDSFDKKFDLIDIKGEAANINIKENDSDSIKVVIYAKRNQEVVEKDNNLYIKSENPACKGLCINNKVAKIEVYIPKDYDKNMSINNNYGNIKVDSFDNMKLDIDSDCGNIDINDIYNLNVESDLGNINIDSVFYKLDLKLDCGNVNIRKLDIKEDSSIKVDAGNVKIDDASSVRPVAKTSLGNVSISNSSLDSNIKIKIDVDLGNIKIS